MIDFSKAIGTAYDRTEATLFKPFEIGKWMALGLSAWLAAFMSGGGGGGFQGINPGAWNSGHHHAGGTPAVSTPHSEWVWLFVLVVALIVIIFVIGLTILITWLGARGQFMLLDNVLHDRHEIAKPWKQFQKEANSYFRFYIAIMLVWLLAVLFYAIAAVIYFWPLLQHSGGQHPDWHIFLPWIIAFLVLILLWMPVFIFLFFMREFGVPIMYRNRCNALTAAEIVWQLGLQRPFDFLLYFLLRTVMGGVFMILMILVGCLTCCIGFLPYINAVLMLPIYVFRQCFTLNCMAQFGVEYDLWPKPGQTPPPPVPGS